MEQVSGRPILQDGDSSRSSLLQPGSSLVLLGRPKGDVLSRYGKGLFQMFPTFGLGGQLVRFQFLQFSSGSGSWGIGETPEVLDRVAALGVLTFQGAELRN